MSSLEIVIQTYTNYRYDEGSGLFYSKNGKQVGSYTRKYARLCTSNGQVALHRLAFLIKLGRWPIGEVDHINGDTHDNRWENLRECSREDNAKNRPKYSSNTSGAKGVQKVGKKFKASIRCGNTYHYLGLFQSLEEASIAYNKAAKKLFKEFKRGE
jgi:hypothetical protein